MRGDCQNWRAEIEEAGGAAPLTGGARSHLSACPECRAARGTSEALRRLIGELEPVAAPPDFEFRLRARMAARRQRPRFSLLQPRVAFGLTAAAACVLALSATLLTRESAPTMEPFAAKSGEQAQTVATVAPRAAEPVVPILDSPTGETASSSNMGNNSAGVEDAREARFAAHARASGPAYRENRESRESAAFKVRRGEADLQAGQARDGRTRFSPVESASTMPPLAIPVSDSGGPLRVLLRDESGGARVVRTRAVSFGAQDIVARERGSKSTSNVEHQGVW
jgi:hypothetical protein